MVKIDDFILEEWEKSKLGRLKLEYYKKFNREPLGLLIGGPDTSAYDDDLVKIHEECLKKGVTWEELLNYEYKDDVFY